MYEYLRTLGSDVRIKSEKKTAGDQVALGRRTSNNIPLLYMYQRNGTDSLVTLPLMITDAVT
jgi:hypothetical protein